MNILRDRSFGAMAVAALGLLALFTLSGCGGGGGGGTSGSPLVSLASVTALYPTNGANWNDYVQGSSVATATDTLCSAGTDTACLHGGELRKVVVNGRSSCSGITASDALGAFDWTCDASTGTARVISTGLKNGKYLSDLLDFTISAWKANSVTVDVGGTLYSTATSTTWWANPVIASNSGSDGSAMTAGDVYIIQSNPTSTYTIGASKVALVVKPGVLVTGSTTTGETLVNANGKDFIWFEGSLDAAGDTLGVFWYNVRFSSLRNVSVSNADTGSYMAGVWLQSNTYNKVRDVTTANTKADGLMLYVSSHNDIRNVRCAKDAWLDLILLEESNYNYLENIVAVHSRQIGIYLYQASHNTLVNVIANNNHSYGIDFDRGSSNNVMQNVVASNNLGSGIRIYSPSLNNVVENVSTVNNGQEGINFFGITFPGPTFGYPTNNLLINSLAVNSNRGLYMDAAADSNHFINLALANQSVGLYMNGISNTTFSGLLKVGSNLASNCTVTGGTNPGLVNTTCANNGSSNATLVTGVTASASFVGKVLTTDALNASNTNGAAQFQNITDWLNFITPLRMWGLEGTAAFPDPSNTGYCGQGGAADNCRIYDWSLALGDTGDGGNPAMLGVLSMPTGTSTITHTWSDATSVTFLKNAVEILDGSGNGNGNGNGLCESGETCLYTPNIGVYQGHGNLISAGPFTAGTITGVTLMKYEFNGR